MRSSLLSLVLLSTTAYASHNHENAEASSWNPMRAADHAGSTGIASLNETLPDPIAPAHNAETTATAAAPHESHFYSPQLQQFIFDMNGFDEKAHQELLKRQAVGGVGGGVVPPVAAVPTQVPTVSTYMLDGKQIAYTQTFEPVPDQWPSPSVGSIGLGTHSGPIGVVKSSEAKPDNVKAKRVAGVAVGAGIGGYLMF